MRRIVLDGESLEVTGRLARAGHLRAIWAHGPLRGMEYFLTSAGDAAARRGRLP